MTTLSVPTCQARPAGWCVAGPGAVFRSARARPFASTSRPTFATTLWACGWCGRPPALPDLCSLEAASAARLFACVAHAIFWFLRPAQQCVQPRPAQSPGISVAHVGDPALHAGVKLRIADRASTVFLPTVP